MTPFSNTSLPLPVLKLAQWHQGGQAIFALPLTQEQQVAMVKSPHLRGYSTVGSELDLEFRRINC